MLLTIPRTDRPGVRGSWRSKRRSGVTIAVVCCPKCGREAEIDAEDPETGHTVNSLGHVAPSLRCPTDGCDFDANVRLEGWDGAWESGCD